MRREKLMFNVLSFMISKKSFCRSLESGCIASADPIFTYVSPTTFSLFATWIQNIWRKWGRGCTDYFWVHNYNCYGIWLEITN